MSRTEIEARAIGSLLSLSVCYWPGRRRAGGNQKLVTRSLTDTVPDVGLVCSNLKIQIYFNDFDSNEPVRNFITLVFRILAFNFLHS